MTRSLIPALGLALALSACKGPVEASRVSEGTLDEGVIPDGIARDAEVEAAVGDQATALTDLTTASQSQGAAITALESDLAALDSDLTAAASDASDALTDAATNASGLATLGGRVDSLETSTSATSTALTTLPGRVDTLDTDLGDLLGDVSDLTSDLADLDGEVDTLASGLTAASNTAAADLATHAADPDAHHIKTVDASDLTLGTLDVARLPPDVVLRSDYNPSGASGLQIVDFSAATTSTSQSRIELLSVPVTTDAPINVALTAHVYLERDGSQDGAMMLTIRRNDCDAVSSNIGTTLWNPAAVTGATLTGDTVTVTGFDFSVSSNTTYKLCLRKFDATAPDTTAGPRGMVATW